MAQRPCGSAGGSTARCCKALFAWIWFAIAFGAQSVFATSCELSVEVASTSRQYTQEDCQNLVRDVSKHVAAASPTPFDRLWSCQIHTNGVLKVVYRAASQQHSASFLDSLKDSKLAYQVLQKYTAGCRDSVAAYGCQEPIRWDRGSVDIGCSQSVDTSSVKTIAAKDKSVCQVALRLDSNAEQLSKRTCAQLASGVNRLLGSAALPGLVSSWRCEFVNEHSAILSASFRSNSQRILLDAISRNPANAVRSIIPFKPVCSDRLTVADDCAGYVSLSMSEIDGLLCDSSEILVDKRASNVPRTMELEPGCRVEVSVNLGQKLYDKSVCEQLQTLLTSKLFRQAYLDEVMGTGSWQCQRVDDTALALTTTLLGQEDANMLLSSFKRNRAIAESMSTTVGLSCTGSITATASGTCQGTYTWSVSSLGCSEADVFTVNNHAFDSDVSQTGRVLIDPGFLAEVDHSGREIAGKLESGSEWQLPSYPPSQQTIFSPPLYDGGLLTPTYPAPPLAPESAMPPRPTYPGASRAPPPPAYGQKRRAFLDMTVGELTEQIHWEHNHRSMLDITFAELLLATQAVGHHRRNLGAAPVYPPPPKAPTPPPFFDALLTPPPEMVFPPSPPPAGPPPPYTASMVPPAYGAYSGESSRMTLELQQSEPVVLGNTHVLLDNGFLNDALLHDQDVAELIDAQRVVRVTPMPSLAPRPLLDNKPQKEILDATLGDLMQSPGIAMDESSMLHVTLAELIQATQAAGFWHHKPQRRRMISPAYPGSAPPAKAPPAYAARSPPPVIVAPPPTFAYGAAPPNYYTYLAPPPYGAVPAYGSPDQPIYLPVPQPTAIPMVWELVPAPVPIPGNVAPAPTARRMMEDFVDSLFEDMGIEPEAKPLKQLLKGNRKFISNPAGTTHYSMRLLHPVSLRDGSVMGQLQVYYKGSWGGVCPEDFDDIDAMVACHELKYQRGRVGMLGQLSNVEVISQGTILMSGVACSGAEDNLRQCPFDGWGKARCGNKQPVLIVCT